LNFDIVEEILAEARPDILVKAQIFIQPGTSGKCGNYLFNEVSLEEFSYLPQISSPIFKLMIMDTLSIVC
jgi:hypothetical protein